MPHINTKDIRKEEEKSTIIEIIFEEIVNIQDMYCKYIKINKINQKHTIFNDKLSKCQEIIEREDFKNGVDIRMTNNTIFVTIYGQTHFYNNKPSMNEVNLIIKTVKNQSFKQLIENIKKR